MIFKLNRSIQYLTISFLFVFLAENVSLQAKEKEPVKTIFPAKDTLMLEAGNIESIAIENGEYWWGGFISDGHMFPFENGYKANLYNDNKWNQAQPLLLSSHGRYIWSEQPFAFEDNGKELILSNSHGFILKGTSGATLKDAYRFVSKNFFPTSGKMPDSLLFTKPQWNTWIELTYNQNQDAILNYAQAIVDNGFSPGVLMIDDTWQENYGMWNFHPGRFPNPKMMMEKLHQLGFKVMLWVCPFISADTPPYRDLRTKRALLLAGSNLANKSWSETKTEPALIQWWNGASAVLDFTNPEAVKWFNKQLSHLVENYGVDGFKFDAGDSPYYPEESISYQNVLPNRQTELYGQFGLIYPLNEYRAMWKMGGQPFAERLFDKGHNWEDLGKVLPQIISQGLMGYAFTCPDMIGGGLYTSFLNLSAIDQELVVRSAQCHVFMPMMQFSAAPWRILDETHLNAVKKAVKIREQMTPVIMQLVKWAAQTGEPVVRNLEYVFPGHGFEKVKDQFMLGDQIMIAPMLNKGIYKREVLFPKGKWKGDGGQIVKGPVKLTIDVPLDRIPYFTLINEL